MKQKSKLIKKEALVDRIAKKAKISAAKALIAYETVLLQSPAFRTQSVKAVTVKNDVAVKVPGKVTVKKVNITKEKAVKTGASKEIIKIVEVKVPVPVVKIKEVIKEVQVVKEVAVVVEKTVVKEVKVVKEVPVEVIKEVTLVREVEKEVIKEVKVKDDAAIKKLNAKIIALEKDIKVHIGRNKDLTKKLAAKPKTVIQKVEVIKEVPVEVIREVEVIKQIDFDSLEKAMRGMKTIEISKKVVGETRTKKEGKIVSRREVKAGTNAGAKKVTKKAAPVKKAATVVKKKATSAKAKPAQKDDLTKIEGIGPKISGLLSAAGISTFKKLSMSKADAIKKILDAAGPRYQMHNPTSWPKQSALAASGKWKELKTLQDKLNGGK